MTKRTTKTARNVFANVDSKTLDAHNKAQDEAARNLFLERRAAMRHAIRVLRERAVDNIDRHDASTLEIWLDEMQRDLGDADMAKIDATKPKAAKIGALTDNEFEVLRAIDASEYSDNLESAVWTFTIADNSKLSGKTISGACSSLKQKGLLSCQGSGKEATVEMTDKGIDAYRTACAVRNMLVNKR